MALLASIDRYLSSSSRINLGRYSQLKVAYHASAAAIIFGLASCSHTLFSYDLRPWFRTILGAYAMFDSMWMTFWMGVIPHVWMLVFGSLIIRNVRKAKRRAQSEASRSAPVNDQNQIRERKPNRQLILVSDDVHNRVEDYWMNSA